MRRALLQPPDSADVRNVDQSYPRLCCGPAGTALGAQAPLAAGKLSGAAFQAQSSASRAVRQSPITAKTVRFAGGGTGGGKPRRSRAGALVSDCVAGI